MVDKLISNYYNYRHKKKIEYYFKQQAVYYDFLKATQKSINGDGGGFKEMGYNIQLISLFGSVETVESAQKYIKLIKEGESSENQNTQYNKLVNCMRNDLNVKGNVEVELLRYIESDSN